MRGATLDFPVCLGDVQTGNYKLQKKFKESIHVFEWDIPCEASTQMDNSPQSQIFLYTGYFNVTCVFIF